MFHNNLPTSTHLNKIAINIHPWCHTCGHPAEDINHIFLKCIKASSFWKRIMERNTFDLKLNNIMLFIENWHKLWTSKVQLPSLLACCYPPKLMGHLAPKETTISSKRRKTTSPPILSSTSLMISNSLSMNTTKETRTIFLSLLDGILPQLADSSSTPMNRWKLTPSLGA